MRAKWVDREETMGGYRCASLQGSDEKTLAGELGEIWEKGDGTYKAFRRLPGGDEKIFSFNSNELQKVKKRLKVPADPKKQAEWANSR